MATTVAKPVDAGDLIEQVIVKGDLAKLTPAERTQYYVEVCKSTGLNPLMKPFEYITLNGKLVLYALRGATDQLRQIRGVSVEEMTGAAHGDIWVVTCKVKNAEGRTDISTGAVPLGKLTGDALANALMKAETKAKRRATLSLCGLGLLDETEVETIPGAVVGEPKADPHAQKSKSTNILAQHPGSQSPAEMGQAEIDQAKQASFLQQDPQARHAEAQEKYKALKRRIETAPTAAALGNTMRDHADDLAFIKAVSEAGYNQIMALSVRRKDALAEDDMPRGPDTEIVP